MASNVKANGPTADIITRDGVLFKREGTVSFTDSYWTVATEISLKRIDDFFKMAEERLSPLANPRKEKWTSSFAVAMRKKVTGKASSYAIRWQESKRRFEGLRMSVLGQQGQRQRRGLLDAGSIALNWLFGVAKQSDLDLLDHKMARLSTATEQVVNLVKEHASVVNKTLWEMHLTAEVLSNLTKAHEQLEFVTSRLTQDAEKASLEVDEKLTAMARAEDIMEAWQLTLRAADKAVDNLAAGLATLAQGKLSPWLFPPQNLIGVMEQIRRAMPEGWNLPSALRDGDLWTFYKEAQTLAAVSQNGIKVFIKIPVVQTGWTLNLFRVVPLPRKVKTANNGWEYKQLPQFLAVSPDGQSFSEVPAAEIQQCVDGHQTSCAVHRPLHRKHGKNSCAVALFLNEERKIKSECDIHRKEWLGSEMVYLDEGRWAISADSTQQVIVNCPGHSHSKLEKMTIPEFGIIQMPPGCGIEADNWTLPASLWKTFVIGQSPFISPFITNLTELALEEAASTPPPEKSAKMARSPWEKITAIQQLLQANDKARRKSDITATEAKTILDSWHNLNIENQYPVELLLAVVVMAMALMAMAYILFSKRKLRCHDTELNVLELSNRMKKVEATLLDQRYRMSPDTTTE